jgi:hypothetical protein
MPRTRTLAQLESELLEKLRSIRDEVASQLANLDHRIEALSGKAAVVRRGGRRGRGPGRPKVIRRGGRVVGGVPGKPLKAFLVEALQAGGSMRALDLTKAVLDAGYKTHDRNFRQTVASALASDRRFRRVRRGIYKLSGK